MNNTARVSALPTKPLIIYDGDCRFCTLWIKRWQQTTGDAVDYLPYQDPTIAERFPEIPREQFETAVQFIDVDGRVYIAAEAVFRARACNSRKGRLLRLYRESRLFAWISEKSYRFVAEHRPLFSALTWFAYGNQVEQPTHFLVRWLFLRGLGLIYLIAFLSLWSQISGLVGSNGIWPAQQTMASLDERTTLMNLGVDRYRMMPTLCWFSASDGFLNFLCGAGVVLALLAIVGIAPAPCLFLLWVIYLSLVRVGRVFMEFQWDNLLLETGLLAIFFAPFQLWPSRAARSREAPPSRIVLWLLRWLLFRLMFESGSVKLMSGDETWRNLTALAVHYETQPLPTWIGWWMHQLPMWLHKASCLTMFVVELAVPFLIFAPRRPRIFAAVVMILFQVVILLTGNYTFFNLLTMLLCIPLLDDFALKRFLPGWLTRTFAFDTRNLMTAIRSRWRHSVTIALAIVILPISMLEVAAMFGVSSPLFFPGVYAYYIIMPFRSVNRYGLFAVMTPTRPEIIVEGSNDGVTWLPYEFKYKPGDLKRQPAFVAPHQPRLDWQMWFAALGNVQGNQWLVNFCVRLLQAKPEVLALVEKNPFPDKPPKFVRALVYEYHFTDIAERKRTGNWWRREFKGEYMLPLSLHEGN